MTAPGPVYIFAGGGTGGHLAPAVAVAERVLEIDPTARVLFLCTDRAIDRRFLAPTPYESIPQTIRPLPGKNPVAWIGFLRSWCVSVRQASRLLRELRPAAVLGLGGFAAGPMARVAAGRVPTALLNPDAIPGKANRHLARRSDVIFTQFEMTAGRFGEAVRRKIRRVGCPVRRALLGVDRRAALAEFGLDGERRTLAVMGGSLGAETVNRAVLAVADLFASAAAPWQVLHVTGPGKDGDVERTWRAAGVPCAVVDFCDSMGAVYAAADLLVGRAGANTIAELTATGTPAVLMPYPFHADNHQRHNAADMVAAGAAVLVDDVVDPARNAERLRAAIESILADPAALPRMAAAALAGGDPADTVARWLTGQR